MQWVQVDLGSRIKREAWNYINIRLYEPDSIKASQYWLLSCLLLVPWHWTARDMT